MSSANRTNPANSNNGHANAPGISQDDVYFTLFRHKWLILGFSCLGVIGALTVRVIRPPLFMSQAKLMVQNVATLDNKPPGAGEERHVRTTELGAQSTIAAEVEILTSGDVAARAAALVGPARILAMKGGGTDAQSAAGVVAGGLTVEPPRTAVITVTFKHPDKTVVQPVLAAVLKSYQQKHVEVNLGDQAREDNFSQEMEKFRRKLAETDEELKLAKKEANVPFPEEAMRSLQEQVVKVDAEIWAAKTELAQQISRYPDADKGMTSVNETNKTSTLPDAGTIEDYTHTVESLQTFKKRQRECEDQGLKESHPTLAGILERIQRLSAQKAKLENQFPSLAQFAATASRSGTNDAAAGAILAAEEIRALKSKVAGLEEVRAQINKSAGLLLDTQPRIARLLSQRAEQQKSYDFAGKQLDAIRAAKAQAAGAVSDMSLVDPPSPPKIDYKKFLKLIGIALGGCIGFGFSLAFLIDMVLDRTIRRGTDVEKHLHLPVFLSIPDTAWTKTFAWPWQKGARAVAGENGENGSSETAIAPWKAGSEMQSHSEGLRERLLTYFEVNNLNLKKPKLVALTGCGSGSGVTTLASGLAAALSKTGDGNVLLVDMNTEQGVAHAFSNGKPGCGISDVLEPENRGDAQVRDNLYLARIEDRGNDKVAPFMPSHFNSLVPRLKASDYDYIIFDMPPVSPTSITPRMASHMDIVLMVLESERTGQNKAAKASALMKESRANIVAVLNKCRQHIPDALSQEL